MRHDPDLAFSVVVGSVEAARSIDRCLEAIRRACRGLASEVIVVDASRDDTAERVRRSHPEVTLVTLPPDTLIPHLWAEGIRRSRGRFVALTTGHCIVPEGWARDLLGPLRAGADGAGAGLFLRPEATAVDRAVFYLRYSAFLAPGGDPAAPGAMDIPGDNAAYRGDSLRRFVGETEDGFWELEYHGFLLDRHGELVRVPSAAAGFGRSFPLGTILRHRYAHGRHFGRWRVREGGETRWRILAAGPLVPAVLVLRIARRVLRRGGHLFSFLKATPALLLLAKAWAAGEVVGALSARRP